MLGVILSSGVSQADNWFTKLFGQKKETVTSKKTSYAATAVDVKAAACRTRFPSTDEMEANLMRTNYKPRESFNHSILGVYLKDVSTPLVNSYIGLTRASGAPNTECKDVVCLTEQTFGRERGILYMYLLNKYKLNFSSLT